MPTPPVFSSQPGGSGSDHPLLAVAVGNTRTRLGLFRGRELHNPAAASSSDPDAVVSAADAALGDEAGVPIILGSVFPDAADKIQRRFEEAGHTVHRIGADLPIPLSHQLDDASTLGQDRALCALAAFRRAEQAVVVIDAGTAITVDFVDGEGIFQGGVIAPGVAMMLKSLHEHTAALPLLSFDRPDDARGVFGLDTRHAMQLGALYAARGLVRHAIERFADAYGAYPQIVATGGDAPALFDGDDLVEHIVPDLQLMGILECFIAALDDQDAPDADSDLST